MRQYDVAVDDDPQRPAGPHPQGRLDIEVAPDQLITGAGAALLRGFTNGADKIAFAAAERQLRADPEQSREGDPFQELPGMPIDPVGQTGITGQIRRRHIVDTDG